MPTIEIRSDPTARRVVYLCMWTGESGGIQVIYEHVRLLRACGVDAVLGSQGPFRRCTWFANESATTPAMSDALDALTEDDVLVVPDIAVGAPELEGLPARRLAFVQNPALLGGPLDGYAAAMVPATVLVPWLRQVSGFAGPVHVVHGFLHRELLRQARQFTRGRPRVLIVERADKHRGEPARIRELLQNDNSVEVTLVDRPLPRSEFTDLFRHHDVYLHLSHPEGFPISILEAFGAGCLVVGFTGCGGGEFMVDGSNCFVTGDGDCEGALAAVRRALACPVETLDKILLAARATAAGYDEESTQLAVQRVFETQRLGAAG